MRPRDGQEEPADSRHARDRPHVVMLWWRVGVAINAAFVVALMVLAAVLARML
jgi:hypothetical protein